MLKCEVGTLTAPAGTGNQTYNLVDTDFGTVKAIILWCAFNTAAGDVDGDGIFTQGFGTFRGGSAQQFTMTLFDDDAIGTSDTARGQSMTQILRGFNAATPTVDFTAELVSLGTAAFTLNWTDAPGSQIKVHYMALGGDDITDALVSREAITTAAGTQDVTVATGFGKPDLLVTMSATADGTQSSVNGNANLGIGAGWDDANEVVSSYCARDAQANMDVASRQLPLIYTAMNNASGGSINIELELQSRSLWPDDGFRVNKVVAPTGAATSMQYLALRGTFTKAVGQRTVPTAAAPQTQQLDPGGKPRGALFFHNTVPANAGTDSTHADLNTFGIGAMDGVHEAWAGTGQDDGNTTSIARRHHSETKVIKMYTPSASGTLASECDGAFNGNSVELSWNDTDTVAREYCYLVLGDAIPRRPDVQFQDPAIL